MDGVHVSRIERWTRQLLENEARKRGVMAPEARSQTELVSAILRHDYASNHSLRSARKLVGSLLGTATQLGELFQPEARQSVPPTHKLPSPTPRPEPPSLPPSAATIIPPPSAASLAEPPELSELSGTRLIQQRRHAELKLHWQISEQAAERARALLGSRGELALRVVSVRPDPQRIVHKDVTEHGPVEARGEWTLLLPSADVHCVSAVGVRHGDRFVSIVHESSRAV
jgi:hypothetical protein